MKWLLKLLPDSYVIKKYVYWGNVVGNADSYMIMCGPCIGYYRFVRKWSEYEKEYARRGFRTISSFDFESSGGYGYDIKALIGIRRDTGEEPIYYSEIENTDIQIAYDLVKDLQSVTTRPRETQTHTSP